jgi:hypothetical protein
MKFTASIICGLCLVAEPAFAQSPVTVTIDSKSPGFPIPNDFSGLSFEMREVLTNSRGGHYFSPKNKALVRTFQTLGIKSLRVGGNTADRPTLPVPGPADADSLFAFADAAGVKVIYTLRLNQGSVENAVAMARHIEQRHKPYLACFAIGNEPDVYDKEYTGYRDAWKQHVAAVLAEVPYAKFCGPCATPTRVAWSSNFANDFARSGFVAFITQHDYPLGDARRATNVVAARDKMLSARLHEQYQNFYRLFAATALSNGLPYRLEEANSFYDAGAENASDTFASALWGLDFMHWWAAHGASGINFHTGDKVAARDENKPCRYAAFWTSSEGYNVHPVGYGVKAFDLGGHGTSLPIMTSNVDGINLTAYAVRCADKHLFVTLINKEHDSPPRDANVAITAGEAFAGGKVIFLSAPNGDISVKTGVTLGGAPIRDNASWNGKWTRLKPDKGQFTVKVPASSAAVVELTPKERSSNK